MVLSLLINKAVELEPHPECSTKLDAIISILIVKRIKAKSIYITLRLCHIKNFMSR